MKTIFFYFLICTFSAGAQSFSISGIATKINSNPGPMDGIPGDVFTSTITFSNSSTGVIKVFIDRYNNNKPANWAICYCYIQCHNIHQDTLTVEIQPLSTTDVTLQFKTDSVNPGIANESFTIYQLGFRNNSQNLDMTASTFNTVGIKEFNNVNAKFHLFPNPTADHLTVQAEGEIINEIKVIDVLGFAKSEFKVIESSEYKLDLSSYPSGVYFVQIKSGDHWYTKNVIVN